MMNWTRSLWLGLAAAMVLTIGCAPHDAAQSQASATSATPAQKVLPRPKAPPSVPAPKAEPLDPQIQQAARQQIESAFASSDPILRANAIEAAQKTIGNGAAPMILQGLSDAEPLVRFAGAMAAGQLRLREAYQPLLRLVPDADKHVQIAARFALHRLGDTRFSHDLEKSARDADVRVRADTVLVLGLLGEQSALKILRPMINDPEAIVRLQAAEAMWRLGDEQGLSVLATGTVSKFADDQIIAVIALAGPKDKRVAEHVRGKLTSEWDEVALAAARSMGELGTDEGYGVAMKGARSPDPRQKVLAALAFGAIGRTDAQSTLANLLRDGDQNVRLAAATGVLQLNNGTVTRAQ
jgi:HEAT repeat protein